MSIRDSILHYTAGGYAGLNYQEQTRLGHYVISQLACDGGFVNRQGQSDLYYTVFGLQLLRSLGRPIHHERLSGYLQGLYPTLKDMDLIEVASLGRCFGFLLLEYRFGALRDKIAARIADFIASDGSYAITAGGAEPGSSYAAFLAVGALQDMDMEVVQAPAIVRSLADLALADGSYVNDASMPVGLVPTTAAAMILLHIFTGSAPERSAKWLISCLCPGGGLAVTPDGQPDLLSTAVGLFALVYCGFGQLIAGEPARLAGAFADSLMLAGGGFCGSSQDDQSDCEYTCYGLLTKGIALAFYDKQA